ncbi:LLM class flavin-dependent oxidoreductase [Bacillus sp. Marseille-P3800]|uniref:LLM class flavin-dependent oxidoreductase n=1 Tax=Bacillus sp. Marseille-P3800 TaxID=2014782 RepID=UPI000C069C9B|nr:LLM class flavin-dependent oxidoreductase [Bacillus sp. Marseille-P3800]
MKVGLFLMPTVDPEATLYEATETVLDMIKVADQLGYEEAWIGEHYTAKWEPIPSPDLVIAQALMQTNQIKLAAGAHLLPYHHPVELAQRLAYLDHLAKGRLMVGVAPGAVPTDWQMYHVDGKAGEHREMMAEALEIMFKIWTEEKPFSYKGKYWGASRPEPALNGLLDLHIKPYQTPHPPIGVAGSSANSSTLKLAGQYGFLPMSLNVTPRSIASHWESVEEGAASSGKTANRDDWKVAHHVLVADTDEEAKNLALNGMMGRSFNEYFYYLYQKGRMLSKFKHDDSVADEDVTAEYLIDHYWYVGSPETVAKKLDTLYEASGGFGTLLVTGYDYGPDRAKFNHSLRLLKEEVVPRMKHQRKVTI